jgi:hypothetical protein
MGSNSLEHFNVREKTIRDNKHLYKRHLQPLIGSTEIDLVISRDPSSKTFITASADD